MYLDALTMACVADELRGSVLGGRVQAALLPDSLSVGLEVYAAHRRHYLLASAHPELGRLLLSSEKLRRGVEKETGLLLLLRKHVRGAALSSVEQPPFERVLRLGFDHPEWGHSELVVEVMGRHSNLILVGPGERVLDAAKRVDAHMSPSRQVLPGLSYLPPPSQGKLPPGELTEFRLQQLLSAAVPRTPVWQVLVSGLQGMSPLLARECTFRAVRQARATVDQVSSLAPLLETIAELLSPLDTGKWQPTLVLEGGQPAAYAPYPITHRGQPQAMPSMSQAIERYTLAAASADPYAAAKRPLQQAIADERARLARRREALDGPLQEAQAAEVWRVWGEWILAYAHTIAPRQAELAADTGAPEPLRIPLDPDLTPAQNAQRYFARYREAQRAAEGNPQRLDGVGLLLRDLDQIEADLRLASSRPEIDAVRACLILAGYLRARPDHAHSASPGGPLSLTSPDGLPILVGRNSRQNDEVTFRRAQGDDWWFHVHAVPGAHVIVQSEGQELPPATMQMAAELAAYFSPSRDEPAVPVDYTRRRYVRRIPGAAPGLVTYARETTVRVAPRRPGAPAPPETPSG